VAPVRAVSAFLITAVLLGAVGLLFGNLLARSHTTCHGTASNGYCDSTKGPRPLVGLAVGVFVGIAVVVFVILIRQKARSSSQSTVV
jgi:hypothetical protein